jgi:hypothetical protein
MVGEHIDAEQYVAPLVARPRLIPARDKGLVFFLHFNLYEKSLSPLKALPSFQTC